MLSTVAVRTTEAELTCVSPMAPSYGVPKKLPDSMVVELQYDQYDCEAKYHIRSER